MQITILAAIWLAVIAALGWLARRWWSADEARNRLHSQNAEETKPQSGAVLDMNFLRRWLYISGFRSRKAPLLFCFATLGCAAAGAVFAILIQFSGVNALVAAGVEAVPGGVGQMFIPLALLSPWLIGLFVAMLPWLFVRSARRKRIEMVEKDLPLMLELLATLSEAGLGFDAALARIISTRLGGRPLAFEFQTFQADLLAGRPRVESLRRLSQRIQMAPVSILVSALAQAEQVGMGISGVLRRQADDMRNRRRERANAFAATLPVKRMLPLVVCFLPGLFVWTLGPFFVQLFKIADSFIQVRNF